MELTVNLMDMFIGSAITLWAFANLGLAVAVRFAAARWQVDSEALESKIQKLVMANNIDRAIKFCNSNKSLPLANACKMLLLRAHSSEEALLQAKDEAMATVNIEKSAVEWDARGRVAHAFGKLGTAAVIYALHPQTWVVVMLVTSLLFAGWVFPNATKLGKSLAEQEKAVIRVYGFLLGRMRAK